MKQKIGILSLSLVTGVATVITMIIPLLVIAFPNKSIINIETLISISSLSALATMLFNEKIAQFIGVKKTILSGLLISAIAGSFPFISQNFWIIMMARFLLGLGIGMYSPHAIALISYFFTGNQRNKLLGMQMGIGALGNTVLLLIAGGLAKISWQHSFLVYLIILGIFLVVLLCVPEVELVEKGQEKKSSQLNSVAIRYLFLCFVTFLIIWGVQMKIPSYLMIRGIESTSTASLVLSLMNISGMLAGFCFGFCYKKLSDWLLVIGFLGAGLSVCGLLISSNQWPILLWAMLFNFVYSFTGPFIVLKINEQAKTDQITKANSFIMIGTILSAYFAPFVWNNLASLFGKGEQVMVALGTMAACLLLIGFGLTCLKIKKTNKD